MNPPASAAGSYSVIVVTSADSAVIVSLEFIYGPITNIKGDLFTRRRRDRTGSGKGRGGGIVLEGGIR